MAAGGAIAKDVPLVVLVDGNTASASEIVSGALQDRGRATIVGTHTFGKGVFQEVTELPNGGALDLTVGQYFTPKGRNLGGGGVRRGSGIKPDVVARDDPKTPRRDEALVTAERVLARKLRCPAATTTSRRARRRWSVCSNRAGASWSPSRS